MSESIPLCIDLDGTLVKQDLFRLAYKSLLETDFFPSVMLLLAWPLKGRAAFKALVGKKAKMDLTAVNFNQELLQFLQEEKAQGRQLILVTANDSKIAQQVADHLGFFAGVMASDGLINLKGSNKAQALISRYGQKGFDYAGDDYCDLPVWLAARKVYVVAHNPQFINAISSKIKIDRVFSG